MYISIKGENKLFINALFPVENINGFETVIYSDTEDPIEFVSKVVIPNKVLGIDKDWPARFLLRLMEKVKNNGFINSSLIIDEVRMIKDEEEIALMKETTRINDVVMGKIISKISEEKDERKICKILGELYDENGAEGFSFYTLIAYGENAAEPHHESDSSKLSMGDSVIIDMGCIKDRYCSDMTRTVFYKEPNSNQKEIYNIVLEANMRAIDFVKPGITFKEIDKVARNVIEKAGFGEYFTHRTGHGIGLEVHEYPDVSSKNNMLVEKGMIFSIEPGIYLPGKFGVRVEDLVIVTDNGCEILSKYPKSLRVI